MGKVLEFRKAARKATEIEQIEQLIHEVDDDISAIANDHSLTPANRRWLLENLLMDIDDQLEEYKRELELAERKLEAVVRASEREMDAAYREYIDRVTALTHSVKNLTRRNSRRRN